ncbi:MAG TPA: Nramp family divalent metal transporter [Melioribacteraceae bacterium]|nr:Nramp family divalent metal transporter [Melioribacteraceae bacterium]
MKNKLLIFMSSIGPGLFLVGYNIGTGSVTTMASAGASHGMMLTWAVLLSCIFTYFLVVAFGRFTVVTGKTALESYKEHFGKGITIFVLATIIFTEMVSSIGVMAIVTDVIREWSIPLTESGEGFNTVILALILAAVMVFTLLNGRYSLIEKILTVFVTLMGLSFILTSFMVIPDAGAVIEGLIPNIPSDSNAALIVTGMIGTTMGGVLYVVRSVTVKQKDWKLDDLKFEKRDAFISSALMFLLSIAVMASAAGTLFPKGLHIENAIDMIRLLEPLAGRFAISIFVAGIVCAGLSSLYPHYMLVPLLLSDYNHEKLDFKKWRSRGIVIFYASLGLVVPIFGGRPVLVMIASQAFTLVVTPVVIILMMILINKPSLMGEYKASRGMNIILSIIFIFSLIMSGIGSVALVDLF